MARGKSKEEKPRDKKPTRTRRTETVVANEPPKPEPRWWEPGHGETEESDRF